MAPLFEAPLLQIGARLDELRQFLAYLDSPRRHASWTELTRTSRAWAYVALGAALEEFVRAFVDELTGHINSANVMVSDLQLGVVSMLRAAEFESVADRRRQEMWDRRADILKSAAQTTVASLKAGVRPLDGRTIRKAHLDSIWAVYGFPGAPLPSPLHGLALRDLGDGRNEVAHGDADPVAFGARKTYVDVLRRIEQVEDIAIHLAGAGESYIVRGEYMR